MTQTDVYDAERFFEQLAQRDEGALEHRPAASSAVALREALRAEAATLHEARHATLDDMSEQELAMLSALKQRLLADGVLGRPQPSKTLGESAATPSPPTRFQLGPWLREFLLGDSWWRMAGVAASTILVGLLVLQLALPHDSDGPPTVRSGESSELVIIAPNPASRAEELARQLRAAGAQAVVAPINANEQVVVVTVEDQARLLAVHAVITATGVPVEVQASYRLSVRTAR
ncbi:MAG: hypothetical protein QM740_21395 [Acidovorax sp.]